MAAPRIEKRCPVCDRELAVRRRRADGSRFLGCMGWPDDCRHTEKFPESMRLRMAGAAVLPGFE